VVNRPASAGSSHRAWIQQALLQSDEADRNAAAAGLGALPGSSRPAQPDLFPGYLLEQEIHRGGQGVVYRAVRRSTGRTVAVKVMREGPFAGESERHRFAREAEILARLDHRNIVGIQDVGASAGGHFLVMDFVDGRPLDRFARESGLAVAEKVRLFVDVCDAVSAAHQRGVIHRDLKPSNILIDAFGAPRILDFGLAKAQDDSSEGPSGAATMTGLFLGSLPWASPEQASGRHAEVDVRSDVYSLGVVLYQLVTGQFPYATTGAPAEVLSAIQSAEPVRPRSVAHGIDRDLETIVLKCLGKDPARRYPSVGELAQDLRRYLQREPIEARRDSRWYVLRRTLLRNRIVAALVAGLVLLTSSSSIALWILYRGKAAEYSRAESQRIAAETACDRAQKAASKADAVTSFLGTMLASPDPERGQGYEVRVVDVLKRASGQAAVEFKNQPGVEIAIRRALGESYFGLGRYAEAEAEYSAGLRTARRSLGENHPDARGLHSGLGATYWIQGKLAEAEPLMRAAMEMELREHGENHIDSIVMLDNLAAILKRTGRQDEALQLNRRAFAAAERTLGTKHETTRNCLSNLAFGMDVAGYHSEAEALYRRAVEMDRSTTWANREIPLSTRTAFANLLVKLGKLDEAGQFARESLDERRRIMPAGHVLIGDSLQVMGRVKLASADAVTAESLFREALGIHQATLPAGSWRIAVTQCDLGLALTRLARFAEAETLLLGAHETLNRTAGNQPRHERTAIQNLAELYTTWDAAEPGTGRAEKAAEWQARLPTTRPSPVVRSRP
jgi:serine/threonine protein kinase